MQSKALVVELEAREGSGSEVAALLRRAALRSDATPEAQRQWYVIRHSRNRFGIFDTLHQGDGLKDVFGRFGRPVANALAHLSGVPMIRRCDIVASTQCDSASPADSLMQTSFAAPPGRGVAVESLLAHAAAEPRSAGTCGWYALRLAPDHYGVVAFRAFGLDEEDPLACLRAYDTALVAQLRTETTVAQVLAGCDRYQTAGAVSR